MRALRCVLLVMCVACDGGGETPPTEDAPGILGTEGTVLFSVREVAPTQQGSNTFNALLKSARESAPLTDADITVEVTMPAHGHSSSTIPVVRNLGEGRYDVDQVVFTMPGTWEVVWHVVTTSGIHDHQTYSYEIE